MFNSYIIIIKQLYDVDNNNEENCFVVVGDHNSNAEIA